MRLTCKARAGFVAPLMKEAGIVLRLGTSSPVQRVHRATRRHEYTKCHLLKKNHTLAHGSLKVSKILGVARLIHSYVFHFSFDRR